MPHHAPLPGSAPPLNQLNDEEMHRHKPYIIGAYNTCMGLLLYSTLVKYYYSTTIDSLHLNLSYLPGHGG